jgi:type IV pilus assembly protein PilM
MIREKVMRPMLQVIVKDQVVILQESKSGWFESIPLPVGVIQDGKIIDRPYLRSQFQDVASRRGWRRPTVSLLLPNEAVNVRKVGLPKKFDPPALRAHIWMELGRSIHLPMDHPLFEVVSLVSAEKDDTLHQASLLAVSAELLRDYEVLFAELRWISAIANVASICSYQWNRQQGLLDNADHVLELHVDPNKLNISLFQDHQLVFHHATALDERPNTGLVSMMQEVRRTLHFYEAQLGEAERFDVTHILLHGDHCNRDTWQAQLEEAFDVPVLVAHGYAPVSELNFWPKPALSKKREKWLVGLCAVWILGSVWTGYVALDRAEQSRMEMQQVVQSVQQQLLAEGKRGLDTGETSAYQQLVKWTEQQRRSSLEKEQKLAARLPAQAALLQYAYTDDGSVSLSVETANREDAVRYYTDLRSDEAIDNAEWSAIHKQITSTLATRYVAEMKVYFKEGVAGGQTQ